MGTKYRSFVPHLHPPSPLADDLGCQDWFLTSNYASVKEETETIRRLITVADSYSALLINLEYSRTNVNTRNENLLKILSVDVDLHFRRFMVPFQAA